jgi:hypothetical protein
MIYIKTDIPKEQRNKFVEKTKEMIKVKRKIVYQKYQF